MKKGRTRRPVIAVCGAGRASAESLELAEAVGRAAAEAGAVVICGGLGGVMEAAAKGVSDAGGLTVGILPGPDPADANPWIDIAVATDMGQARNAIIVCSADAVIAVAGEYGTLSEIALALKMGKPVISLRSWQVSPEIVVVNSPEEAVREALRRTKSLTSA